MWKIEYTKTFLKELTKLPEYIRGRIENLVFYEIKDKNPFEIGIIEKMKGFKDIYKIRIVDYRIGLKILKKEKKIIFNRVAHRKDIYKIFP